MNATKTRKTTAEDIDDFPTPDVDLPEQRPQSTALALNVEITDPALVFVEGGTDVIAETIESKVSELALDIASPEGRREIASVARKIASSVVFVDEAGKNYVAEIKERAKVIDAERKRFRDRMTAFKEEVRRPLTEWEQQDKRRIEAHEAALNAAMDLNHSLDPAACPTEILDSINRLDQYRQRRWEEFEMRASKVLSAVEHNLKTKLAATIKAEEERAELARLRREARERQEREREEMIRAEAARTAREEAERIARVESEQLERARKAAEAAKVAADERAERAERERKAAIAKAKQDAERAVERERQRAEAAKVAADMEIAKRSKDQEHRVFIESHIIGGLINHGIDPEIAHRVVEILAGGDIPHITINY